MSLRSELGLRLGIHLDHGSGELRALAAQRNVGAQKSIDKAPVDLVKRVERGEVDIEHRRVTKQPLRQGSATSIGWRVASTNKLDALKGNPATITAPPEASMFNHLTQKGDEPLKMD